MFASDSLRESLFYEGETGNPSVVSESAVDQNRSGLLPFGVIRVRGPGRELSKGVISTQTRDEGSESGPVTQSRSKCCKAASISIV